MTGAFDIGSVVHRLSPQRPLLIVDADEVILKFVDGFDTFLRAQGLFIDLVSYRLHGNVKRLDDGLPLLNPEVTALLEEFRCELDSLEAVEGALESLERLRPRLDMVMLTNISPAQAAHRTRNLEALGLPHLPVVANEGLKGPAIKALAAHAGRPVFFIDDIPHNINSAAEIAPEVYRIHLIGDERLKPLLPVCEAAHLRAQAWEDAERFILEKLAEAEH